MSKPAISAAVLPGPVVSADWVAQAREERPDARIRVVEVRWTADGVTSAEQFAAGHIAGATWLDLDHDLSAPPAPAGTPGGRHPLPTAEDFAASLSRAGITNDTVVIAADSMGGTRAARLWWMLDAIGVQVAILDGGFAAWGEAPEVGGTIGDPAEFRPVPWPESAMVSADGLVEAQSRGAIVIDARGADRWAGKAHQLDDRYGHIPGAASAPATDNLTPTGRFESIDEARKRFGQLGIEAEVPNDHPEVPGDGPKVIAYCGSGVTACTNIANLRRLGINARLYVGSWSEWGSNPHRPLATSDG